MPNDGWLLSFISYLICLMKSTHPPLTIEILPPMWVMPAKASRKNSAHLKVVHIQAQVSRFPPTVAHRCTDALTHIHTKIYVITNEQKTIKF